jgi:hypothetical protein
MSIVVPAVPRLAPAVLIDEQLIDFTTVVNKSRICRIKTNELLTFVYQEVNAPLLLLLLPVVHDDVGLRPLPWLCSSVLCSSGGLIVGVLCFTTNPLSQQQRQQ